MEVLVNESERGDADRLIAALVERGHHVQTCRPDEGRPEPCIGLQPGRPCPVENTVFDVAVDVRSRGLHRMTTAEAGAMCALHADVPLVVVGSPPPQMPAKWAEAVAPLDEPLDEIVRTIEEAGADAESAVGRAVRRAVERAYRQRGGRGPIRVEVSRTEGGQHHVLVRLSAPPARVTSRALADAARHALRPYDDGWLSALVGFAT